MNFRHFPSSVLLAALLMAAPNKAVAWGAQGHEIVAAMALRELTPAARRQVAQLLGGDAMMIHDANWADEVRDQRRDTGSWHYVNIPLDAPGYDARRDCPRGDCVVAQIGHDLRRLGDRRAGGQARAEALRFLIHFVADVHQPLHAADDGDRGGNDVHVGMGRERASLHKVWDADVVEGIGLDLGQGIDTFSVVNRVIRSVTPAQHKAWMQGTPAAWANEAHAIARDHIYPPLGGRRSIRLSPFYPEREAAIAQIQLAKAAVRLAWLLNGALK